MAMLISMVLGLTPLLLAAAPGAPIGEPPEMEAYGQRVTVSFATEEAARQARVRPAPLLDGKEWAVTCRWDDNGAADVQMRDVMAAHGYRGDFYLNEPRRDFGADIGRRLLQGGNRIGGHTMTHPYLPFLNRNRLFWEVAAIRMQWEAATDSPVCSFSFPFEAIRDRMQGDLVQRDIGVSIVRAGYYHTPFPLFNYRVDSGLLLTPLLPPDGAPIDEKAKAYLSDPAHARDNPVMSFSMHVWYKTPEAWAKFEEQLDAYGRRPNWWYCNQNEYAAYRYQFAHTSVEPGQVAGNRLTLDLRRPVLRELNDEVPLTLLVEGVAPQQVTGVSCETAQADILPAAGDHALLNLHHDRSQALPAAIGLLENADNHAEPLATDSTAKFPDLTALLVRRDAGLEVTLDNRGEPLSDVTITYRLPLAWTPGVVRHHVGAVKGPYLDTLSLAPAPADHKYTAGAPFYAAQVDFVRAGSAGRLHLSCRLPTAARDATYPQGGFRVLGPIPEAGFDLPAIAEAVGAGTLLTAPPPFLALPGLQWRPESARAAELFDPEVVETSGDWRNQEQVKKFYLLRSTLESDAAQEAAVVREPQNAVAVFVNGRQVQESASLKSGRNELIVVVALSGRWFEMQNGCSFIRLAEPGSQRRLTNIRYLAE